MRASRGPPAAVRVVERQPAAARGTMPVEQATDAIVAGIGHAPALYYRLLLVAGGVGAGKTQALVAVGERTGAPAVNVGLDLARSLHELTVRERPLRVRELLEALVESASKGCDVVLLDNIEALFDAGLQQDPLRLLQGVSRSRTVVAAWPGTLRGGTLRYAAPPHREYREYPARGLLTVALEHGDEGP